jgi:hypothetical protein
MAITVVFVKKVNHMAKDTKKVSSEAETPKVGFFTPEERAEIVSTTVSLGSAVSAVELASKGFFKYIYPKYVIAAKAKRADQASEEVEDIIKEVCISGNLTEAVKNRLKAINTVCYEFNHFNMHDIMDENLVSFANAESMVKLQRIMKRYEEQKQHVERRIQDKAPQKLTAKTALKNIRDAVKAAYALTVSEINAHKQGEGVEDISELTEDHERTYNTFLTKTLTEMERMYHAAPTVAAVRKQIEKGLKTLVAIDGKTKTTALLIEILGELGETPTEIAEILAEMKQSGALAVTEEPETESDAA